MRDARLWRRIVLTVHLVASVGWIGAVIAYLALNVASMTATDAGMVRMAWSAMEIIGWWAIVPLALGSLLTGVVVAVTTPWGLFRHYWVLISLLLTIFCTVVLIAHMPDVSVATQMLQDPAMQMHGSGRGDLLHAGGGLAILLVIATLNVFKPRGLTPYGWRVQLQRQRGRVEGTEAPR